MSDVEAGGFRALDVGTTYGPADEPLDRFYVPVLGAAVTYDRAVGYWSARELVYAARGVARFIAGGGVMRLAVGAELKEQEVQAVMGGEPLEAVLAEKLIADPLGVGVGIVEQRYLEVLSYLAREGRLHVRVGVPVDADGRPMTYQESRKYFHTKYGVLADAAGDKVAFIGSNNDTAPGWQGNHETFSVYTSWQYDGQLWHDYAAPLEQRFEALWEGSAHGGWTTIDLPEAVRQRLVAYTDDNFVPAHEDPGEEQPDEGAESDDPATDVDAARERLRLLRDAPTVDGGTFAGVVTAPVVPLPHQTRIVHRAVTTYPRSYLLADEVGLGKTIEAGLILRELLLSEQAKTALLLVPASVLTQWQEELWEKLALRVPRFDGKKFLDVDGTEMPAYAGSPWNAHPVVLGSSHLARRKARRREILEAGSWDIVLVDEAHHARRRGSKATDTPNTLLALLQDMKRQGSWRVLYLASATPMQMYAHEAWDLIALFGLPGRWGQDAAQFHAYYEALRAEPGSRNWVLLQRMLQDYLSQSEVDPDPGLVARARQVFGGHAKARLITDLHKRSITANKATQLSPIEIELMGEWLRRHTPMRDRVFRTTRQTMRDYQAAGILPADVVIPVREVEDEFIALTDDERRMYERIEDYISRHYNAYMEGQQRALGFIMTVYRRRLTSSFEAIRKSLHRRLEALEQGLSLHALLDEDDQRAVEDATLDFEEGDQLERSTADLMAGEIVELRDFLNSLERLTVDSKMKKLNEDITEALLTHDTVVVFTQYTDTMDYMRDQLAHQYGRIACYSGRGGELWDPETESWAKVTKVRLKTLFREGEDIKILIGTDSMSEGLNLQTSGRLINVDVPWNFMRVEQRIGRVDRIGGRPRVDVTNYFYANTVEEQVYKGIAEDYDWFTAIVGDAQPVLAAVEGAMTAAAMAPKKDRDDAIAQQVQNVNDAVEAARTQDVKISDIADTTVEAPPELDPAVTLGGIRDELTTNPLTSPRLIPEADHPGTYRLATEAGEVLVSFDRDIVDRADVPVQLVTYGTPAMDELLTS